MCEYIYILQKNIWSHYVICVNLYPYLHITTYVWPQLLLSGIQRSTYIYIYITT